MSIRSLGRVRRGQGRNIAQLIEILFIICFVFSFGKQGEQKSITLGLGL
jgi:hypothetical protein